MTDRQRLRVVALGYRPGVDGDPTDWLIENAEKWRKAGSRARVPGGGPTSQPAPTLPIEPKRRR